MPSRQRAVRATWARVMLAVGIVGGVAGAAAAGALLLRGPDPKTASADEVLGTTTLAPTTSTTLAPTTTSTTVPPTTTEPPTTVPPTTAPPTTEPPPGLRSGAEGPEVLALQEALSALGYWLGEPDGHYGLATQQAVMAFQKANGLHRDGVAGPDTVALLATAARPGPTMVTDGIEIDLERQLLFVVQGGQTVYVLNTSTGRSGWRTPRGDFVIERQIDGMRHADLGDLYRPKYFTGGIAVHGSGSIPGQPASHGCARVSFAAMDMLWASGLAEIGTRVVVY